MKCFVYSSRGTSSALNLVEIGKNVHLLSKFKHIKKMLKNIIQGGACKNFVQNTG